MYKKALNVYNGVIPPPSSLNGRDGLCLMLPCLYWGLNDYMGVSPDTGEDWYYTDTKIWFPEIKSFLKELEYVNVGLGFERWKFNARINFLEDLLESRLKTKDINMQKLKTPILKPLAITGQNATVPQAG